MEEKNQEKNTYTRAEWEPSTWTRVERETSIFPEEEWKPSTCTRCSHQFPNPSSSLPPVFTCSPLELWDSLPLLSASHFPIFTPACFSKTSVSSQTHLFLSLFPSVFPRFCSYSKWAVFFFSFLNLFFIFISFYVHMEVSVLLGSTAIQF